MTEEWVEIPNYEGLYWVSSLGRVKSKRGIIKQRQTKKGTMDVHLSKNGVQKRHYVHRLVLTAFKGESDRWGIHKDDQPDNNVLSNLEWFEPKRKY